MDWHPYLKLQTTAERSAWLNEQQPRLPLVLVASLFELPLPDNEKLELLKFVETEDTNALELLLLSGLAQREQNLAAQVLRFWAQHTPRRFWFGLIPILHAPFTTQRVRYTILELLPYLPREVLDHCFANNAPLLEYSAKFHALLFRRALQYQIHLPILDTLVDQYCEQIRQGEEEQQYAFPTILDWLQQYGSTECIKLKLESRSEYFDDIYRSPNPQHERQQLSPEALQQHIEMCLQTNQPLFKELCGANPSGLAKALSICSTEVFQSSFPLLASLLITPYPQELKDRIRQEAQSINGWWQENSLFKKLHQRFRDSQYEERACSELSWRTLSTSLTDWQQCFFDLVYRKIPRTTLPIADRQDPWFHLVSQWLHQHKDMFTEACETARQLPPMLKECSTRILSHLPTQPTTIERLMELAPNVETSVLIESLANISNHDATKELINLLCNEQLTVEQRNEICAMLRTRDLTAFTDELWQILQNSSQPSVDELLVRENILLLMQTEIHVAKMKNYGERSFFTKHFSHWSKTTTGVKKALQTARAFEKTFVRRSDLGLTPLIEMQYKACVLHLREQLEPIYLSLMNQGVLQNKLDLIGYARPVKTQMESFEHYLGHLPVIREIPHFSYFKLHKMLLSICNYRPNKRFTFDSLKAYALFILTFTRSECPFGLAQLVPTGFTENEMLLFCKDLHTFQDWRNRATHEDFHLQTDDIEQLWNTVFRILENASTLGTHLLSLNEPAA